MADSTQTKSFESDKAALGRKLLNKHQKTKTTKKPTQDVDDHDDHRPSSINNAFTTETTPAETTTPIQTYFTTNNYSNFFDSVAIDDPELKHNEIFNLHQNTSNETAFAPINSIETTPEYIHSENHQLTPDGPHQHVTKTDSIDTITLPPDETNVAEQHVRQQLAFEGLQSQLQAQVLSNGQLLGENAQIRGELARAQATAVQRDEDVVQLRGRLDNAESRLAEMQRHLEAARGSVEERKYTAASDERTITSLREERDQALQDASELLEKLSQAEREHTQLKVNINHVTGQLDMANIKVQQLTRADSAVANKELELSAQQVFALEKQIADLNLLLTTVNREREHSNAQFQQYTGQLNEQLTSLTDEMSALRIENDNLSSREHSLVTHISDMEKLIQNSPKGTNDSQIDDKDKIASITLELRELNQQCDKLKQRFDETCIERDELLKETLAKKAEIAHLHSTIEQLQSQQPNSAKLLEEIRSDKVAASRAIEQNMALKSQLGEMEAAFVSTTHDKVTLTDRLTAEQHRSRELQDQVQVVEGRLRTLSEALEVKDRELTQMRERQAQMQIHEAQVAQLTDRLRHYEAQEHSAGSIRAELQLLAAENSDLRKHLQQHPPPHNHAHDHDHNHHDGCHDHDHKHDHDQKHDHDHKHDDDHKHDHDHDHDHIHDHSDALLPAVGEDKEDQLQQEIFQLKQELDQLRSLNAELALNSDVDDPLHLSKAKAMEQLEEKFTRTMGEVAKLEDEKQRLEHLVLQLQSETETIGEYVALYQRQRAALAQRTADRETQLRQLAADRQQLQQQLRQLSSMLAQQGRHGQGRPDEVTDLLAEIQGSHLLRVGVGVGEGVGDGAGDPLLDAPPPALHSCAWCSGKLITI